MTWFTLSANQTAAENERVFPFVAVDLDFPTAHVRVFSGAGEITINGSVFSGVGELGRITFPTERAGLDSSRKTYELAGADVNPALVLEADIDGSFGREVIEYLGFFNPATGLVVAEPEINWEGRIDSISRRDGYEPSISVNCEHRLVILDKTGFWRWTDAHQKRFYSSDTGFSFVDASLLREIIWGGIRVGGGVSGGSGGDGGGGGGTGRMPRELGR